MKAVFPTLLLLTFVSLSALAEITVEVRPLSSLKNQLLPFTTDRCSYSLDGTWTDCCLRHDYSYWQGGAEVDRLEADETFRQCMEKETDVVTANSYFQFVRWFGNSPKASFRWGYGWKYPRALRPLSQEELRIVQRTPFRLDEARKMPVSRAPAPLPFPTATGNTCLDEVTALFYQSLSFEVSSMTYSVHSFKPLRYQISFPEIPGQVYLATMAIENESACLAPRWSEESTRYLKDFAAVR